tara:strand:- start:1047 stop:1691 length:645 start_codon:yes stop_codon:yes gene_type:complete
MNIDSYKKLQLNNSGVTAYETKLNILNNSEIIFPHEETINDNRITNSILKNSVIVLGVIFETIDKKLTIKDKIFILDGHHRFKYIIQNSIDGVFDVVLLSIHDIKIESHNSELLTSDDIFLNKIKSEKSFSQKNKSSYYISLNNVKYFSNNIININELYSYKKQLLDQLIITPIKNSDKTNKSIVNFTPITSKNFSINRVFPYKSTWITPRFDL